MTITQADIDLICLPADANGHRPVKGAPNLYFDQGRGVWLDSGQDALAGTMAYLQELASKARANGQAEQRNGRSNGNMARWAVDTAQEPQTADTGQNSALSVAEALRFFHPDTPFEIRIIGAKERNGYVVKTTAGYFDDPEQAATAVKQYDGRGHIYFGVNPANPDLLARAYNRLEKNAKSTTSDSDITRRRWLIVDVDPVRPAGISATDSELAAARITSAALADYLPWKPAARAMSGNGYHLLYRVDLPNDKASSDLLQGLLKHLGARFDNDRAGVDQTMYNASRITKVYGCLAVKGDNMPERPHRRAGLYPSPDGGELVTADMIRAIIPAAEERPVVTAGSQPAYTGDGYTADMIRNALDTAGVGYGEKAKGDGLIFSLDKCLTSSDHSDGAAVILTVSGHEAGKVAYKCHHNTCSGKAWADVRAKLFPDGAPTNQTAAENKYLPQPVALADLLLKTFSPLVFLVDGLIAKGHFVVLGGRPKSGKSWWLLQLAQALDTGMYFLDLATRRAKVLYIALEDGERRIYQRCQLLKWQPQNGAAFLFELLTFDGDNGEPGQGLAQIDVLAQDYDVIIIDTFAATRSGRVSENDNSQSAAIANYLAKVAHERDVTIILSHHTRKGAADDPFDTLRGAGALRAGYDVGLVLQRKQDEREALLYCESRDVEVSNMTIRQAENGQGWECLGSGAELHKIRAGRAIVETILAHGEGETVNSLAEASGKSKATIGQQLRTAEEHGLVVKWTEPPKGRTKPAARWWLTEAAGGNGLPADLAEQYELLSDNAT